MLPVQSMCRAVEPARGTIVLQAVLPVGSPQGRWPQKRRLFSSPWGICEAHTWFLNKYITICRYFCFCLSHLSDGALSPVTLNSSPKHSYHPWVGQRIGWQNLEMKSSSLKLELKKVNDFVFGDFSLEPLTGAPLGFHALVGINCISKISSSVYFCYFTENFSCIFHNDALFISASKCRANVVLLPSPTSHSHLPPRHFVTLQKNASTFVSWS